MNTTPPWLALAVPQTVLFHVFALQLRKVAVDGAHVDLAESLAIAGKPSCRTGLPTAGLQGLPQTKLELLMGLPKNKSGIMEDACRSPTELADSARQASKAL